MSVEQIDDALHAQITNAVGVGTVFEEQAYGDTLQGLGLNDGSGNRQIRVSAFEATDVDHGAGPDAVELTLDFDASRFELAGSWREKKTYW